MDYASFVRALEQRRAYFKAMGARATDHAALTAYTAELTPSEAEAIFQRGLAGEATADDTTRFTGHMLLEMARMSVEDGLVMQLHIGSYRNHNDLIFARFGRDMGADIPVARPDGLDAAPPGGLATVVRAELRHGFSLPGIELDVFTAGDLSGQRDADKASRKMPARRKNQIDPLELSPGDPVVHEQHGVGRYVEMVQRCYWSYLRIYAPGGSELLETSGLKKPLSETGERGTAVFAGHFVLSPSQQHVVTVRYRLPLDLAQPYRLFVRKQAGTFATPLHVTAGACAWDTDLSRDRTFTCPEPER